MSKLVVHESHSLVSDKPWSRICRRCAIRENQSPIEKRCAANANYPPEPYEGPMWSDIKEEVSEVTDLTMEQIEKKMFELAKSKGSLLEDLQDDDVHKIKTSFLESETVTWYLISKTGTPEALPNYSKSPLPGGVGVAADTVCCVTYNKAYNHYTLKVFQNPVGFRRLEK